jgi:hypothetical protein
MESWRLSRSNDEVRVLGKYFVGLGRFSPGTAHSNKKQVKQMFLIDWLKMIIRCKTKPVEKAK